MRSDPVRARVQPVSAVVLVVLATATAAASETPTTLEEAASRTDQAARTAVASEPMPGLGMAVALDGELVWARGFGLADPATGRPVTTATRFGIGSVTKTLTMVLCARLVQAGRLDWDAPVETYLADFRHSGRGVTVRRIGAHLSGMNDDGIAGLRGTMEHFTTTQALARTVSAPLAHPPGSTHEYATGTFNVVAAVVESVTGSSFHEAMREWVLEPLAMDDTVVNDPRRAMPTRTRFFVDHGDGPEPVVFDPSHKLAGAGYVSTPSDLVRFASALLDPDFLSADQRRELFDNAHTTEGTPTGFGLGWRITRDEGERVLLQAGGGLGISCYLVLYPERHLALASLTNLTGAPAGGPTMTTALEAFKAVRPVKDGGCRH